MSQMNSSLRHYLRNKEIWSQEDYFQTVPSLYHRFWDKDQLTMNKYQLLNRWCSGEPNFVLVIPSYNNSKWVSMNLKSVLGQKYPYYRIIYLDDNSRDNTYELVSEFITMNNAWGRCLLLKSPSRNYSSGNRFSAYHLCDDDEILCMLDGDDWLANPNVLMRLRESYKKGCWITYGSYSRLEGGRIRGLYGNEIIPNAIKKGRHFRKFRWTTQHLRTGYAGLFKRIKLTDFLDRENGFYRCCTDLAEMFPILEMAYNRIEMIPQCLLIYNKDASLGYKNSYFNQKYNHVEKLYRDYVMTKIKNCVSYRPINNYVINPISKQKFWINSKIPNHLVDNLLQILNLTSLNYLGKQIKIKNPLLLYNQKIKVGYLDSIPLDKGIQIKNSDLELGNLVVSVDDWNVHLP